MRRASIMKFLARTCLPSEEIQLPLNTAAPHAFSHRRHQRCVLPGKLDRKCETARSAFTETVMKTRQKSFRNGVGVFSKRFTSKKERAHDHVPFLNDLRENRGFAPTTNELSARELRVCTVTLRVRRRQCMYAQAVCTASTWFNWTAALSTYFYSRLKIAHPEHTLCR
jgi:hypothetical protein